jgi:hypothetical protein
MSGKPSGHQVGSDGYRLLVVRLDAGPNKVDRSYPSIVETTRNLIATVSTPAIQQLATSMPSTLSEIMDLLPVSKERNDAQEQNILFLAAQEVGLSGLDEVVACFQAPSNSAEDQAEAVPVEAQLMKRHHELENSLQRDKPGVTLHANFPPLSTVTSTMYEEIASESLENPSTSCRADRAADVNNNQSATDEGTIQKQTSPTSPMLQISNTERLVAEQHSLSYSLTREHAPTPPDLVIHADIQADVIMEETTTDSGPENSSTDAMGVRLLQLSGTIADAESQIQAAKFQPVIEAAVTQPKRTGSNTTVSQPADIGGCPKVSASRVRKELTSTPRVEPSKHSHSKPSPAADDMKKRENEHHPASGDVKKQRRPRDSTQPRDGSSIGSRSTPKSDDDDVLILTGATLAEYKNLMRKRNK